MPSPGTTPKRNDAEGLFPLGYTWLSSSVLAGLGYPCIRALLARHAAGDWGDVTPLRAEANRLALDQGYPIVSQYAVSRGCVCVITEEDRVRTLVLAAPCL